MSDKQTTIVIGGNITQAEAALRTLQRTGQEVTSLLQRDFDQLGIKSALSFDGQRRAATAAYDKIKSSGIATADELTRAQQAHAAKMVDLDRQQFGQRISLLQTFKQNWLGVSAITAVAAGVAAKAFAGMEDAARGQAQAAAFGRLAASHGAASDQIIADLKRVSGETVTTRELIEKAGTAMLTGIASADLPKLMEIARASSKITGQTVTKSFDDISMAVARQSKMILDNLGIIVDVDRANKTYAATMGIVGRELSDAEKKQAFMNATLAAGQEIIDGVGEGATDAADSYARLRVATSEAGDAIAGLGVSTGIIDSLAEAFNRLRRAIAETPTEKLQALRSELQHTQEQLDTAEKSPRFLQAMYGGLDSLREKVAALRQEIAELEAPDVGPPRPPKVASVAVVPVKDPAKVTPESQPDFVLGGGLGRRNTSSPTLLPPHLAGNSGDTAPNFSAGSKFNLGSSGLVDQAIASSSSKLDDEAARQAGERLAALQATLRNETQVIEDEYQQRMQLIKENSAAAGKTAQEQAELELKVAQDREEKLTALKKKGDQERMQSALATANVIGGSAAQLFGTLAATQDQSSRKGFKQYKEFAKAQAGISTALAVLNAMSTVQPWYAALAASIVSAGMGAVQIAKIDSMQYQGARSGGGPVRAGERYLVGERGPEIISMGADGTVLPGGQLSGARMQTNQITNVFQLAPRGDAYITAEIMRAAPAIIQQAVNATLTAINSGGSASRAVGRAF